MLPKTISKAISFFSMGKPGESGSALISSREKRAALFLNRYPGQIFVSMVITLILSGILVFFTGSFEKENQRVDRFFVEEAKTLAKGASGEVSALLELGQRVGRMNHLKTEVERIIRQKISGEDSIFLEKAITELENYKHLNQDNHED